MLRHLYLLMKDAEIDKDEFNELYPDVMTLPINEFRYSEAPLEYELTESNIERLDLLMNELYAIPEHDDIILWLNNIFYKGDLEAGDKLIFPVLQDINTFYVKKLAEL
jgi:hypothetical protein